jgi:diguanylate cyclase (GGDEF)-like protein
VSIFEERSPATKRLMVTSAAGIYGGAAFVGLLEDALPGGPSFSLLPAVMALVFVALLLGFGVRFPFPLLAALGPIGVALIGYALATSDGPGDAAVLYMWPVLWIAYFFGRAGSIFVVVWIGIVHGVALASLPAGQGNMDRWLDVMVSVSVVAGVVYLLSHSNRTLVAQLAAEARVDQLTGVLNRRGFEERMEVELDRARREDAWLGVATFDIDHFKRVNDEFGHEVGDRVLARLGEVLRTGTRATDVVARTGGEEFVALLPGRSADETSVVAERIRAGFAEPSDLPPVTVSAGVSSAVAPESGPLLLAESDTALYAAKRAGRDRTVVAPGSGAAVPPVRA